MFSKDDFRSYRHKQPSESFIEDEPEGENPNPEDIIDDETWAMLTVFPDDTSLRTSENLVKNLK